MEESSHFDDERRVRNKEERSMRGLGHLPVYRSPFMCTPYTLSGGKRREVEPDIGYFRTDTVNETHGSLPTKYIKQV